ncbi:MAG: DNA primase subunit [uncultured marine phage]|uniref:DNA primase subunit n=1 Tax=uncultured marine phage TaxID=707152 RepID=A0A8D9FS84_9VIRU|nr:MAG: DNA primase subunit [uncultured marine phage]
MINRDEIRSKIQIILNKAHKLAPKKVIKETPDGLAFADPIGGDSMKNPYMKRAHLYWDSFYVICYDDEGYKMPFTKFCSTFGVDIGADQRLAIYDHIDNNISYNDCENEFLDSTFEDLVSLEELQKVLNSGNCESQIVNFQPVQKGSGVEFYLRKRKIFNYKNIYQAEFYKGADWKEPVIVILNRKDDKILGLQVRNLKEGYKRMFKIYNFEHIIEWTDPKKLEDMDMNQLVMYNKLSYFYNILNVDFNSNITIFEGYLDSIFYPNSIGVAGVNTDMRFLENNNLDIQYFYDNDEAGWKKSTQKVKDGYSVFLWNKMFEEIVDRKNAKDPYYLMNKIKKVKDLNKLAMMVQNPYKEMKLSEHFSKDQYDARYIPVVKNKFSFKKKNI